MRMVEGLVVAVVLLGAMAWMRTMGVGKGVGGTQTGDRSGRRSRLAGRRIEMAVLSDGHSWRGSSTRSGGLLKKSGA